MIIGNVRVSGSGPSRLLHRRRAVCLAIALLSLHISCGLAPRARGPADSIASYGYANDGVLVDGVPLPESGPGFLRAKLGEDTRWAAPVMRDLLERAALTVAR